MTLMEIGIVIGKELEITHRDSGLVIVSFNKTEIRENGILTSSYGVGKTIIKAKKDYCKKLMGARLAIDAFTSKRREIQLPKRITL